MPNSKPYNDRALSEGSDDALPKPQISIIVDGNSVFKPSMKTFFVDDYDKSDKEYKTKVMGTYCSCDMVASTHTVCTCNSVCTCEAVAKPTTPTETVCSCDSVCTCLAVCSCDGYQSCSCESHTSGGGGYVSCGSPCACVPVH